MEAGFPLDEVLRWNPHRFELLFRAAQRRKLEKQKDFHTDVLSAIGAAFTSGENKYHKSLSLAIEED